jgi:hypothetical protein
VVGAAGARSVRARRQAALANGRKPGKTQRFVLCEVNVSSVSPFPPASIAPLVEAVKAKLGTGAAWEPRSGSPNTASACCDAALSLEGAFIRA